MKPKRFIWKSLSMGQDVHCMEISDRVGSPAVSVCSDYERPIHPNVVA